MARTHKILKGRFEGFYLSYGQNDYGPPCLHVGNALFNKDTVDSYDVITEETTKSGSSAILRGILGTTVLGPVGILAGLTAKNKSTYMIAIQMKDGEKFLIELDDGFYKRFVQDMF